MPQKRPLASDSALPDPPVPPDSDLRQFPYMPLHIMRLLTSETWLLGSGDECKAAMTLWCVSWQQVPAGSLPKNDRMLAILSGYGAADPNEPGWETVREHAMRGWYECSDGRLYHPVLAETVTDALSTRVNRHEIASNAARARWAKRSSGGGSGNASGNQEHKQSSAPHDASGCSSIPMHDANGCESNANASQKPMHPMPTELNRTELKEERDSDSDSDSGSLEAGRTRHAHAHARSNGHANDEPTNGTAGFTEFMMIYPRQDDRLLAQREWMTATLVRHIPMPILIRRAHVYAAEVEGKQPQFIKAARTWLRAQEPDPPEKLLTLEQAQRVQFVVMRLQNDPDRKWSLHDLNLTNDDVELLREACECSNSPYPSTLMRKLVSSRLS